MKGLDRLGWAAGISFGAYGLRLGVRVTDARYLERLRGCLPCGWRPGKTADVEHLFSVIIGGPGPRPGVRGFHIAYAGIERVARTLDLDALFETLESSLRRRVAESARRSVFVHAGVVGWKGRAILIPGLSGSGKTTLVAELVRAGATYYSDEFAVLDARGRVHPYAKPLSVREGTGWRQTPVPVEALGGVAGSAPLEVGGIIMTGFKPGARWRPRVLSPGLAVLGMLEHAVAARRRPKAVLETLQAVASNALAFKGPRGDARTTARVLLEQLENGWTRSSAA